MILVMLKITKFNNIFLIKNLEGNFGIRKYCTKNVRMGQLGRYELRHGRTSEAQIRPICQCHALIRTALTHQSGKMECAGKGRGTRCTGSATRRCGRCGVVAYCSVDHQVRLLFTRLPQFCHRFLNTFFDREFLDWVVICSYDIFELNRLR